MDPVSVLVYCGIDEAGYGPLIGPLCVGCATVVIESIDDLAADVRLPALWETLAAAVSDRPDRRGRVAIADSKRLKGANGCAAHPLRHLERGVLAVLGTGDTAVPTSDTELFARLGVPSDGHTPPPWYDTSVPLPLATTADELAIAANRLSVAGRSAGIRFADLGCTTLDGAEFNRRARGDLKSTLNFRLAMEQVARVRQRWPDRHPRIVVDRQGGRARYGDFLQELFPDDTIATLGETDRVSRYRLNGSLGPLTLSFEVESEARHLPCALASMVAKLVRELHMERLNRFFRRLLPELKPTAGYVEDGRRFLADVRPELRRLGIREDRLVRSR